jgi:hypothetical protein
MEEDN